MIRTFSSKNFSSITRGMDRSSLSWQRLGFMFLFFNEALLPLFSLLFHFTNHFIWRYFILYSQPSHVLFEKLLPCQNVLPTSDTLSRAQGVQKTLFYSNCFNNILSLLLPLLSPKNHFNQKKNMFYIPWRPSWHQ